MHTKLCGSCYSTIHAAAEICPRCGGRQMPWLMQQPRQHPGGTLWLPVPALIIAIVLFLITLSDLVNADGWGVLSAEDKFYTIVGFAIFFTPGVALAVASLASQKRGQGMAIAATVLLLLSMFFMAARILG